MGLRNVIGNPVSGADFFDREEVCDKIWARLETDNVLLPSPRRVGKTSLMRKLQREATEHGFEGALFVDVGGCRSEAEFVGKLLEVLDENMVGRGVVRRVRGGVFRKQFQRLKKVTAAGVGLELNELESQSWKQLASELIRAMHDLKGRWLILLDELGILVQGLLREDPSAHRARDLLQWFRDDGRLALSKDGHEELRWVIASSIGLPTIADLHNLSDTINDLFRIPVDAFSETVAHQFLEALAENRGFKLEHEAREAILKRVGWAIPYFLQLFFSRLTEREEPEHGYGVREVEETFESLLSDTHYRHYFDWWTQRLGDELGPVRALWAHRLLTVCARSPEGASRGLLQGVLTDEIRDPEHLDWARTRLLSLLESDGYWVREGDRYRFRSNMLREYWLRNHA